MKDHTGQIWLQQFWSLLNTMWWVRVEFFNHLFPFLPSSEFPSIYALLVHSAVLLRTYVIAGTVPGAEQNTKMSKNLQVHDILSKKESWHSSGPISHAPVEETEAQRSNVPQMNSNGLSAYLCPVRGGVLFLSCGTLGPKLHVGLSRDGFDSPLRINSSAGLEAMTEPYRHCVVRTVGPWACRRNREVFCGP